MQKLKERWGIQSNFQIILILLVFSITGSSALKLAAPVLDFLGLDRELTSPFIYWPIRILLIFPIYQVLLIAIGTLFGQFRFFWNMEKKMLKRMGLERFIND
jgi:hypothetical protein